MTQLPIESSLPQLQKTLRFGRNAVLVAPPGAGKTTRIPLALLGEPWLAGRRIVMLEPRRLAARAAAHYMAGMLQEQVGETVGYRVRLDTRVGPGTRIEVITEGVLTRLLQADQALENVAIVIFDEFHERNIHADLGLAFCLQSQAILREDLRILVMSATLDTKPVADLLGDAPVLYSEGRAFPIETFYQKRHLDERIEPAVVRVIQEALQSNQGDILAFLPGAGEIRRVAARLGEVGLEQHIKVAMLYGNLPQEAQNLAIAPSLPGQRKIVLATSIAETSLTVEGVQVVADSGLMRVSRFSPRTGMTRLETVRVSRSAADQRRGRAGRLGPGVCYRLWTLQEDLRLEHDVTPEILESDLAPLALELAAWGAKPSELRWLNAPPAAALDQAGALLYQLGAVDKEGTVTPHGRRMAESGLHPRLAHMIITAASLGLGRLACELAALLSERDIFRGDGGSDADLRLRIGALRAGQRGGTALGCSIDIAARRRIASDAARRQQEFGISSGDDDDINACGLLLAFAYPDRIAQQKAAGRFLLRNGRGAAFFIAQPLASEPYLVVAELDDQGADSRIFLAAPIDLSEIKEHFQEQITEDIVIVWDRAAQAVRSRRQERLGALMIKNEPHPGPAPDDVVAALLAGIGIEGLDILPWTQAARRLQQRLCFMHLWEYDWPDSSDEALAANLNDWLAPHLYGLTSRNDLQRLNLTEILTAGLTWEQRRELDEYAPTHIKVPSGQRIPVDYGNPAAPVLAVRLQEMFGLQQTPAIARGRVPLTLHLLSPAQRPVQVTRDLASFWRNAYFEVRKDLLGRYPKHYWPEDPLNAIPTNRTRPRQ